MSLALREDATGLLVQPSGIKPVCSVLLVSGSSGRVEAERARLLAEQGAAVLAFRWFGGVGQPPGICEVPLETFHPALDNLYELHPRLVVMGTSKGAEAALLLAARDTRIRLTVGMSPSSVVWGNLGPGLNGQDRPYRSSWTVDGNPLPFVPYDDRWSAPTGQDPPANVGLYEQSLERFHAEASDAAIPCESIAGKVLLSAGGDDRVWPSLQFARALERRRALKGRATTVLTHPEAGHRVTFPGEPPVATGVVMQRGGRPSADAELGAALWSALVGELSKES